MTVKIIKECYKQPSEYILIYVTSFSYESWFSLPLT